MSVTRRNLAILFQTQNYDDRGAPLANMPTVALRWALLSAKWAILVGEKRAAVSLALGWRLLARLEIDAAKREWAGIFYLFLSLSLSFSFTLWFRASKREELFSLRLIYSLYRQKKCSLTITVTRFRLRIESVPLSIDRSIFSSHITRSSLE